MKRIILLSLICLLSLAMQSSAWMPLTLVGGGVPASGADITRVETKQCDFPNTANGTCQMTWDTSTSAGALIVVRMCVVNGFGSPAVTDSATQSYTAVFGGVTVNQNGSNTTCDFYYKENSASGVTSVTVEQSASAGRGTAWATYYTGIATASSLDQSSTFNTDATSPWASNSITTTQANEVLLGMVVGEYTGVNCSMAFSGSWNDDGTESSGVGWDGNNGNQGFNAYQIVSSTGSYSLTGTESGGSCTMHAAIASFKGS